MSIVFKYRVAISVDELGSLCLASPCESSGTGTPPRPRGNANQMASAWTPGPSPGATD